MAQEGFDTLRTLVESRYLLSMITARRAAQLKLGVPSLLTNKKIPHNGNAVSIAMKELELGAGVRWGDDLPSAGELKSLVEREKRDALDEPEAYSVSQSVKAARVGSI